MYQIVNLKGMYNSQRVGKRLPAMNAVRYMDCWNLGYMR